VFQRGSSRRAPMSMRVLLPSVGAHRQRDDVDLLDTLQGLSDEHAVPKGTDLLILQPPRWNEEGQMYQLAFEGRASQMSNKNVQLICPEFPSAPTLQVGKLRKNLFNVDLGGCISAYQAFAIALAIFDQSSVRRRF